MQGSWEGNGYLQTSLPIADRSQGRDVSNHVHFEDPVCEIPPLTFKSQFHLNYVAQDHFKSFPNDKHSRKDTGECKVPGLRFNKEEDKIASGCCVVSLQDGIQSQGHTLGGLTPRVTDGVGQASLTLQVL